MSFAEERKLSPVEEEQIRETITAMTEKQRAVALECMPTYQLTLELYRRDTEKETVIAQIKGTLKAIEKEMR